MGRLGLILLQIALLGLAGCASIDSRQPQSYLLSYSSLPPQGDLLTICSGYACFHKSKVRLDKGDIAKLKQVMAPGARSAEAERAAIRQAVAWLETRIGKVTGLSADKDHRDLFSSGDKTQADCIDEAANTTSYLLLLGEHGLLHHHQVRFPTSKGYILNGVYPHATALIRDNADGKIWAVDSWMYANGEPPVVVPEPIWRSSSTRELMARYGHKKNSGGDT